MSLHELKIAILKLSPQQLRAFAAWFQAFRVESGEQDESDYLMSTEANRQVLAASRQEFEKGNLIIKTLEELEALASDAD